MHHSQAQSETPSDETSQLFQWKQASVVAPMPVVFFTVIWEESILSLPVLSTSPCRLMLCHGVNLCRQTANFSLDYMYCSDELVFRFSFQRKSFPMSFMFSIASPGILKTFISHDVTLLHQTYVTLQYPICMLSS